MSDKKQSDVKQPGWLCKVWLWVKRWWLPIAILLITSTGLACALSIPQQVFETPREPANDKSAPVLLAQSNLRLAFLYITGGAIAVVGLIETFRKNNNEKLKNDQDKEKNDREHLRQVRADRRERYTKAVEQLGDEKSPIRMGGVYTLVGLVDEWLEEENLSESERLKEGQVIINNLCAYIRSPFTLASHYDELSQDSPTPEGIYKDNQQKFYTDKAEFKSETDVRLSVIKEIHDRLQGPEENTPGTWSDFEYDFSGSAFFYPINLTKSYYKKPINFSGSTYQGWANFTGSTYEGWADFSRSTYKGRAKFSRSTYEGWADFAGSTYKGRANFSGSTYMGEANFSGSTYEKAVTFSISDSRSTYKGRAKFSRSTYMGEANFSGSTYEKGVTFSTSNSRSTYEGWANFSGSTYMGEANFSGSTYEKAVTFSTSNSRSTYKGKANFSGSTYKGWANFSRSTYEGWADFTGSTYKGRANFSRSTYEGWANFSRSTYKGRANFSRSTYNDVADFSGSIFYQEVYFGKNGDNSSFSRFTDCAPHFYDETNHKNTLFGSHNNDFTVITDECYPIDLNSEGLPLDCKFLTSEQKEYLADKFQEIEKINDELFEVKDPEEKVELSKNLQALNKELYEWQEEATTVKVEDVAAEDTES